MHAQLIMSRMFWLLLLYKILFSLYEWPEEDNICGNATGRTMPGQKNPRNINVLTLTYSLQTIHFPCVLFKCMCLGNGKWSSSVGCVNITKEEDGASMEELKDGMKLIDWGKKKYAWFYIKSGCCPLLHLSIEDDCRSSASFLLGYKAFLGVWTKVTVLN